MDILTKVAGTDFYFIPFATLIHQPTIKEIALLGERTLFDALAIFAGSSPDYFKKQVLKGIPEEERGATEVELNYTITSELDVFYKYCLGTQEKRVIESFLFLIFESLRGVKFIPIGETKMLLQLSFIDILSKEENKINTITLDAENFSELKETVSDMFTYQSEEDQEAELNPAGEMAQKIADKMAAAAERRAKIYGKNKAKKDEESVIGTMASILATSDGIPITEVLKLTFPQVLIQLNRTQMFQQYRTQITLGAFGGLEADDVVNWQQSV